MSEPMERHISITSTTTNTNGVVTQVTHASVHVVASGDCFDRRPVAMNANVR